MGCISGIVRTIMFVFNFLCLLIGLGLLILGSLFYVSLNTYEELLSEINIQAVPIVLIIIGVFIFLVSFLGCCGAMKSSKCMLITYAIILLVMLIVQLVVGIYAYVHIKNNYDTLKKDIATELTKELKKYETDNAIKTFIDNLQLTFKCCGVNDQYDYMGVIINYNKYPGSCCGKTENDVCVNIDEIYKPGCGNVLFDIIDKYSTVIFIVALVFCGIELLGGLFAIYLSRKK